MKIKEVEELVGITRKNIRFYEEQGLLQIDRKENGYREYHQKDIDRLYQIKLYRKLSLPIETIKDLFDGKRTLQDCLEKHQIDLEKQKHNIEIIQQLCKQLENKQTINVLDCLDDIEKLEQQGMQFMDINKDIKRKRKSGALLGAMLVSAMMILLMVIMAYGQSADPLPIGLFLMLESIPLIIMIALVVSLISRFKEIEEGEIEEAKRY